MHKTPFDEGWASSATVVPLQRDPYLWLQVVRRGACMCFRKCSCVLMCAHVAALPSAVAPRRALQHACTAEHNGGDQSMAAWQW